MRRVVVTGLGTINPLGNTVDTSWNSLINSNSGISKITDVPALTNDISAIILTNTTNSNRDNLISEFKKEKGGLSGEPIQEISTNIINEMKRQHPHKLHVE